MSDPDTSSSEKDQEAGKKKPAKKKVAKKAGVKVVAKKGVKRAKSKKVVSNVKNKKTSAAEINSGARAEVGEDRESPDPVEEAARVAEELAQAALKAAEEAARLARVAEEEAARIAAESEAPKKQESKESPQDSSEADAGSGQDQEAKGRQDQAEPESEKIAPPEVPDEVDLVDFRNESLADLYAEIERLKLRPRAQAGKADLIFDVLTCYLEHGTALTGRGVLEMAPNGFGMLRDPARSFRHESDDIYVSAELIKKHDLRPGHALEATLCAPKGRAKFLSVDSVKRIEDFAAEDFEPGTPFDDLTSLFPEERFVLERGEDGGLAVRVVDLVAPLGKGQRGLIVAPPRGGKTILLKQIAQSLQQNYPSAELIVLLLDERPEEVTDFEDMVGSNVFASTFDEPSRRHAEVANLVLERARRLVEQKKDVVILLDSLTRLARGFNNANKGGPIGSGGLSPKAITECRKFFGAARYVEQGGSLTILATCLVETDNRMDDIIFEELKGTGNMELRLDQILAEQRIYPAIHLPQSGTRNDDRLYHKQEFPRVQDLRRELAALPVGESLELLLANLGKTESNAELLLKGLR